MKGPTLVDIINTFGPEGWKIEPEIQGVGGAIEYENKTIFAEIPYTPETVIHELFHKYNLHTNYPNMTNEEYEDLIEKESQKYLKNNPNIREYLWGYLRNGHVNGGHNF